MTHFLFPFDILRRFDLQGVFPPSLLLEWVDGGAINRAIHSGALGQPAKCALLCAAKKKRAKRRGKKRDSGPLCGELSRKAILQLLQLTGKASSVPLICTLAHWTVSLCIPPVEAHTRASVCLWALSGRISRASSDSEFLSLMMRADVRRAHEYWCGGLFHRRTEGSKMAAL